jgi:hypothetical protein
MLRQFTDKCGQKRIGIVTNCVVCNKEFVRRQSKSCANKGKYCSPVCRGKAKQNRVDKTCTLCGNQFKLKPSQLSKSKSGLYFCTRKCKDEAQKLGGIKEIMPAHFGTAKVPDYRALFTEDELVCSRCGYDEFSSSVDIHHVDHDRSNNSKENLIPLCSNCHKALHNGKWEHTVPKCNGCT